jgi:hypothetical protein
MWRDTSFQQISLTKALQKLVRDPLRLNRGGYRMTSTPISPIQRLPTELLLEIFKNLREDYPAWYTPKGCCEDPSANFQHSVDAFALPRYATYEMDQYGHRQHQTASVCRQWKALLGSSSFVSDYNASKSTLGDKTSRIMQWIETCTGDTLLNMTIRQPLSELLHSTDSLANIRRYFPRLASLHINGCFDFVAPIFQTAPNDAGFSNLRSLVLAVELGDENSTPTYDPGSDGTIASVAIPQLIVLFVQIKFFPMYLQMFAPALKSLRFDKTPLLEGSVAKALPLCFPGLHTLECRIETIAQGPSHKPFIFPFNSLKEIHLTLRKAVNMLDHAIPFIFPNLEACPKLELISISDRSASSLAFELGLNHAKTFRYEREFPGRALPPNIFEFLPDLENCELSDMPDGHWEEDIIDVYHANTRLVESLLKNLNFSPRLKHLKLRDICVPSQLLLDLLKARCRTPLRLTWSGFSFTERIVESTFMDLAISIEKIKTKGSHFDYPLLFYAEYLEPYDLQSDEEVAE